MRKEPTDSKQTKAENRCTFDPKGFLVILGCCRQYSHQCNKTGIFDSAQAIKRTDHAQAIKRTDHAHAIKRTDHAQTTGIRKAAW